VYLSFAFTQDFPFDLILPTRKPINKTSFISQEMEKLNGGIFARGKVLFM
jgi:hypothetical protein